MSRPFASVALGAAAAICSCGASADGTVIDRLYDPYVQLLENELEFRMLAEQDNDRPEVQSYLLGFGRSLSDRWSMEVYAIGGKDGDGGFAVDASEIELKWQLTEQGEYAVDWGMLFELEREFDSNVWEASSSVLAGSDFGRWSAIANLDFIYEWGGGIENEFETTLHVQTRYRLRASFEPGLEFHAGQDTVALGPVVSGLVRVATGKKIRWSAGLFAGLDSVSPASTFRLNLEYEF